MVTQEAVAARQANPALATGAHVRRSSLETEISGIPGDGIGRSMSTRCACDCRHDGCRPCRSGVIGAIVVRGAPQPGEKRREPYRPLGARNRLGDVDEQHAVSRRSAESAPPSRDRRPQEEPWPGRRRPSSRRKRSVANAGSVGVGQRERVGSSANAGGGSGEWRRLLDGYEAEVRRGRVAHTHRRGTQGFPPSQLWAPRSVPTLDYIPPGDAFAGFGGVGVLRTYESFNR